MEEQIKHIRNLVAKGKIEDALKQTETLFEQNNLSEIDIIRGLRGKLTRLKRDEMIGILTYNETVRERAVITNSLLSLLTDINESESEADQASPRAVKRVDDKKEIKILFLASNSDKSAELQLEKEFAQISNVLQKSEHNYELFSEWAVTVRDLTNRILEHQPDIIHFAGHGANSSDDIKVDGTRAIKFEDNEVRDESGIYLKNQDGQKHFVRTSALSSMFKALTKRLKIQAIFFNSCYSKNQADALEDYIPVIIGMRKAISDDAALVFSRQFYATLGSQGNDFEFAFDLACAQLDMSNIREEDTPLIRINRIAE